MRTLLLIVIAITLSGCVGLPKGIEPVRDFDVTRYLGTWYEIARLDHSFERGLEQVTATYTLRDDGGIHVINRGYSPDEKKWKEAIGKAYFVNSADIGHLKVSFFGPFYGSYILLDIDKENYRYALVSGPNKSYLWILSREPVLSKAVYAQLTSKAKSLGYDTDSLIRVKQ